MSASPAASVNPPRGTGVPSGAYRGRGGEEKFGETDRKDMWWLKPVLQGLGLLALIGYANYGAVFGTAHYHFEEGGRHYLSPFYSPYIKPAWLPSWVSPALLILVFPVGFRATCYYFRRAYYRSFFADPVACAVGEPRPKGYRGETQFPFILQNLHRYFLYAALIMLALHWYDVFLAATFVTPDGRHRFGIGGGTLVILASTALLSLYTLSCHSLRHIIGGKVDCFSCAVAGGPRHKAWSISSALNEHHMGWGWWSLFAVCFADFYIRMCSMGYINDPVFFPFALFNSAGGVGM